MIDIRNMDCLELLKSMEDKSVDLVVTDPPYIFDSCTGGGAFGSKSERYHAEYSQINGGVSSEVLDELIRVQKKINMYIWGNWKLMCTLLDYFKDKSVYSNILSWHKSNPVPMCSNKYLTDTEYCLFVREKGVKLYGGYNDSHTYWITKLNTEDKKKWNHPTIKPEFIIEQLIKNSSQERERVLDPFLGSGTTAICCKRLNRDFIGCEIDKTYYETCLKRVNQNTLD